MQNLPHLGPRAIRAYNRLAQDIATYNYRFAKPSGIIGEITRRGSAPPKIRIVTGGPWLPKTTTE